MCRGTLYEERAGQRLCHVHAGGRRIATFEPQSTVCQALGLPAAWDGRLARLGRALTWPFRHGYQPVVVLALVLLGGLALVAGPAAPRSSLCPHATHAPPQNHVLPPLMQPRVETIGGRAWQPVHAARHRGHLRPTGRRRNGPPTAP